MATLKDLNAALRSIGPVELGKRVYSEINSDNVFTYASAVAYAWIFAIFPLLLFLLTLVPHLPLRYQKSTVHFIEEFLYNAGMPWAVTHPVVVQVNKLMETNHIGLMSLGLLLTLYAASGGMNMTMSALDAALEVTKPRSYLVRRVLSVVLTVAVSVCMILIVFLLPIGAAITAFLTASRDKLPGNMQSWVSLPMLVVTTLLRYGISLMVMQVIICILYTFGPSKWRRIHLFSPGSVFAAFGWIATGLALRFYFTHFNDYSKTYGFVGSGVIMLTVFYLDATIILIGAEIDSEVEKAKDTPVGTPSQVGG